jgi:tetratricopeptide (TPR) repeat protein
MELDGLILSGQAELDQKHPLEARKIFRRAAELFGDEPGLFADIGNRFMLAGLLAEAVENLQKGIEAAPADMRPYPALIQCLDALGEAEKAEDLLRAALRRFGPVEGLNLRLAKGALELRSWDEALTNALAVLSLNATHQEAHRIASAASEHIYGDPKAYQREYPRPGGQGQEIKIDL